MDEPTIAYKVLCAGHSCSADGLLRTTYSLTHPVRAPAFAHELGYDLCVFSTYGLACAFQRSAYGENRIWEVEVTNMREPDSEHNLCHYPITIKEMRKGGKKGTVWPIGTRFADTVKLLKDVTPFDRRFVYETQTTA